MIRLRFYGRGRRGRHTDKKALPAAARAELKQTAARCDDDTDWVFSMRFTLAVSVAKGPRASCEQF